MARIRSVHPGLFTDEAFVTLSMTARVLLIGIWTECDDKGAFEWKPITLKMRIMPADNVDVPALLGEMEAANIVKRYSAEGREYGAVRNFRKYQRPKKPTNIHPMPDEFRTYVALKGYQFPTGTPPEALKEAPVPHQFPTGTELSPQMEDEGGRRKDGGGKRKEEGCKKKQESRARGRAWCFDDFWNEFPNKVGKQAAERALKRVQYAGKVEFDDVMAGLRRYVAKTDDRPWCNPATWLNQGRWDDQPARAPSKRGADGFLEIAQAMEQMHEQHSGEAEDDDPSPNPESSGQL